MNKPELAATFIVGIFALTGLIIASFHLNDRRKKLLKLEGLFPNSPFPVSMDFDGDYYFDLSDGHLDFELIRGTKANGIYGVTGIAIKSAPRFSDGMNMMKLLNELNKLTAYIQSLKYNLTDSWSFIDSVRKEVAHVNTLDYLETKESQENQ